MIIRDKDESNRVICEELVSYDILIVKRNVIDTRYGISDTFADRFNEMFHQTNHDKIFAIMKCLMDNYHIRDKSALVDYTVILDQMIEMKRVD